MSQFYEQRTDAMSIGVRELTILGEFKPFGLVAEALDGKTSDNAAGDYHYCLFSPEITKQRDESDQELSLSSDRSDHELFVRGNRIIWSIGSRVYKRFTLPSPVIKACWCRMGDVCEALLCVLQMDNLTIYNTSGEVAAVPLPRNITSIWPLPYGLLLQQGSEGNSLSHIPFSSSSPFMNNRDLFRQKKDAGPHNIYSPPLHAFDLTMKGDGTSISSHLILKDPLEEPEPTYIEERGKLNVMKEFDERTIWTSDVVPLMASYNKGKMQHSLWAAELLHSNLDLVGHKAFIVPAGVLTRQFSFRRIWQGKCSKTAASKVFLATDDDAAPIVCLLLQEQKKLLSVRLQSVEINNEIIYDVTPDMSWSIPAIAAAPVVVSRPRVKVGLLPFGDIIALTSENVLLLYSGKQCLCKYMLPPSWSKDHLLHYKKPSEMTSSFHDLKVAGLTDAVEERVNIILNSGQIYRCALRCSPSSSLANDCITAMAEGLTSSLYSHFLVILWGHGDSAYLSKANQTADSEWESFCSILMRMCRKSSNGSGKHAGSSSHSSWEFLINSRFHKHYCKNNSIAGISSTMPFGFKGSDSSGSLMHSTQETEESFYKEFLVKTLDSLHGVYENLKLDNLRKRWKFCCKLG